MKQVILFIALIFVTVLAQAEVFRCKTTEGVVYSERPCAKDAAVVDNLAKKPSEENIRAAERRLASDMYQVEVKESQDRQERQAREMQRAREAQQEARASATAPSPHVRSTTVYTYRQSPGYQSRK